VVMNPRTHPPGARPDFTLPRPNPNPARMTDALWWLVCMREALEPDLSENGGTYANKAGSHNIGDNLPDHGEGDPRTDHSIRHAWNRTGPWWRSKTSAHDWTFLDAQRGDYRTINKYTRRMIDAMRDPNDLRPDLVVFYTLGNLDGDVTTEGYNELKNGPEYSGDTTHTWHRHDSFFRNAVGDFWAMWKVLTIDMGWTYEQWQQSITEEDDDMLVKKGTTSEQVKFWQFLLIKLGYALTTNGVYDDKMEAAVNAHRKKYGQGANPQISAWHAAQLLEDLAKLNAGKNGAPGKDGRDGVDGKDGALTGTFTVTGGNLTVEAGGGE
jgi:hypothetical protein